MNPLLKNRPLQFTLAKTLSARGSSDLLVTFAWIEKKKIVFSPTTKSWDEQVELLIDSGDFKGKTGETALVYLKGEKEKRLAVVGLGEKDKISKETIAKAYKDLWTTLKVKNFTKIALVLPIRLGVPVDECAESAVEGLLFGNYSFEEHKSKKEDQSLEKVIIIASEEKALKHAEIAATRFLGISLCKDMINLNADHVTPEWLGNLAIAMAKANSHLKATVFDKKRIEKEKMGLLLAVNQGSPDKEPRFIVLEYHGAPQSKSHTVLIGKGVTYDTGGLNLKPTGSMETMKADMSGAAIVLSTVYAAALLGLKVNVTAVVPSTENAIGPDAFKPGDVFTSLNGMTVEIGNTDAEGRLILADAISWVEKNLKPTKMIDVATLTGSIVIALGEGCAGLFTPDDKLADALLASSQNTGEKIWRMPLIEEYNDHLKSFVADVSNTGKREGGSISAALFLQKFVEKTPWAHLDIAGVAFTKFAQGIYPKNATGFGVRLLLNLLEKS